MFAEPRRRSSFRRLSVGRPAMKRREGILFRVDRGVGTCVMCIVPRHSLESPYDLLNTLICTFWILIHLATIVGLHLYFSHFRKSLDVRPRTYAHVQAGIFINFNCTRGGGLPCSRLHANTRQLITLALYGLACHKPWHDNLPTSG